MDAWSVFTPSRYGTPITDEEREAIYAELKKMETLYDEEEWIEEEVEINTLLVGDWDRELVFICLDHDINMLRQTLVTGIVTEY